MSSEATRKRKQPDDRENDATLSNHQQARPPARLKDDANYRSQNEEEREIVSELEQEAASMDQTAITINGRFRAGFFTENENVAFLHGLETGLTGSQVHARLLPTRYVI